MITPEVNLKLETKKFGQYSIDDMINMFGKRISKALDCTEPNQNGRTYLALNMKKMSKICKRWKFWNRDIREAYRHYYGMVLAPFVIINHPPIISCGYDKDIENELKETLIKEINSRYAKTINDNPK